MTKDPLIFVGHILDRIERIFDYCADGEEAFHGDPKTQDAVIRSLEVIGEAAKRIPEPFREAHPTVPWRGFARMRDVLIHQYEGVDLLQVWRVVEDVLPEMKKTLSGILQQATGSGDIGAQ
ncbi:MAG TPA: DUF86 domain-containing protein [Fimbriimonas sp.]|nr:DUF86 domain-containing protein [Fimbriimonas sp.]